MTRKPVAKGPVRQPLTAQINHQSRIAARPQIARRAAIFLNVFRAPRHQQNRAARALVLPQAQPQLYPVRRLHIKAGTGIRPLGHGVKRRSAHEIAAPSCIAIGIEPSTESLPVMKAVVGFISPASIA